MTNQNLSSTSPKKFTELSLHVQSNGTLHRVAEVQAKEILIDKIKFYKIPEIEILTLNFDVEKVFDSPNFVFHVQRDGKKQELGIAEGRYFVSKDKMITLSDMVFTVVKEEWIN